MELGIYLIVALMLVNFMLNNLARTKGEVDEMIDSGIVGNMVVQVANGYIRKIVDYESEVGEQFVGPNVGDYIELTDDEVFKALKSDGSLVTTEPAMTACADASGTVLGTAKRSYVPCEFPEFIPGGTNKKAYARFERVNLTTVPDTYTTGYSQIEGVIYIGSRDEDEAFAYNEGDPKPRRADDISNWVNAKGLMQNTSNVLTAPTVSVTSTDAGALKISFEMVRNNQLAVRTDGSVPMTGNLNFAQNSIDDLEGINFSTLNGSDVVDVGSLIASANSSSDFELTLNSENKLVMTAIERIDLTSADIYINGLLTVSDNTIVNAKLTTDDLEVTNDAEITGKLSADEIEANSATFAGVVEASDFTAGNGASLSYQIQRRGVVSSGSAVNDITCTSGAQQMLVSIVDLSPEGRPVTGWSIAPSRPTSSSTGLTIRMALEDGTVVNAPTSSYMKYEQWCG